MRPRISCIATVVLGVALALGCTSGNDAPQAAAPAPPPQPVFTAELGKEALLDLMRQRPNVLVNRFDVEEWAKVELNGREDGWYDFGGAFQIKPAEVIYTFTIRPAPEARACTFHWQGSFAFQDGRWVAQPPSELLGSALGGGK